MKEVRKTYVKVCALNEVDNIVSYKVPCVGTNIELCGGDPDNIAGVAKRSENVESTSLDDDSESEDESVTKSKSRGSTAPKHTEGKAQKCGVQFQKLPDGK